MQPKTDWRKLSTAEIMDQLFARIEALEGQLAVTKRQAQQAADQGMADAISRSMQR